MKPAFLVAGLFLCLSLGNAVGVPVITPTLDCNLDGTNSVIYCPTFQCAWDQLCKLVGGPVQMKDQDLLVKQMNAGHCPTGVIPEEAHVALAGFADQGIKDRIQEALRTNFGDRAPSLPSLGSDQKNMFVAYSHFQLEMPFPRRFIRSKTVPVRFKTGSGSTDVQFFGVTKQKADKYASQVKILHYAKDQYVLSLKSLNGYDIVLSKTGRPASLRVGVEQTRRYLQTELKEVTEVERNGKKLYFRDTLSMGDLLVVPIMDLNVAVAFTNLCNRLFTNPGFELAYLFQSYQDINFKMDEAGAFVRSTAFNGGFLSGESSEPRRFIYDSPFLLTAWMKQAPQPFLAIWVASPDVLLPFKAN